MLSEDEFAELTEALEGRNLQANWWATESFALRDPLIISPKRNHV